jgi:tetratricopeptide (TPR) repeat protein
VKSSTRVFVVTIALATLAGAGTALARNPNCAGGILYLTQGLRDKQKGNLEDYKRQMLNAVQKLEACEAEDPKDYEAVGYLGWAYAEIESAGPAGRAFDRAVAGLKVKGDKNKLILVEGNRDSYWTTWFNDGINRINSAQMAYADFNVKPKNEAEVSLMAEATKKYMEALTSLTRASLLKPNDPRTLRNLGAVHAFMLDFRQAENVFQQGLKAAPNDSDLVKSLRAARMNNAGTLIDEKKYDEAIAYYGDLIKSDESNPDLHLGHAQALFEKASSLEGDAAKPAFKAAGAAYAKAAALKPGDANLSFNAALAFQKAGEHALAEAQWRASVKNRPDDPDALAALASTLAELKKFDEAVKVAHQALLFDPKNKTRHRQLGGVYTKAGNNAKATEELMMFLALENGQPVNDPAAHAKKAAAGSAAAKTLASSGAPEQIVPWKADGESYETWVYWSKNSAFHFKGGALVQKSEWSAASSKTAASEAKK